MSASDSYPWAFTPPGRKPHGNGLDTDRWEWKKTHPRQWAWIKANADSNPFAYSLTRSLHEFGKPSVRQQAVLDRHSPEES